MIESNVKAIEWCNQHLKLLDQRVLPHEEAYVLCADANSVADAIRDMVVRGAPAIGISAAYGVVLAARIRFAERGAAWKQALANDIEVLWHARPTAVNLHWALKRMQGFISGLSDTLDPVPALEEEAVRIHQEDIAANYAMGQAGAEVIAQSAKTGRRLMTHCNTGSLATGGYGTALGVIRSAYHRGLVEHVHADETRPWMQGARLTVWELMQDNIPVSLNADSAAAYLMQQGNISWVIVGADRITANGDTANKIGTYSLAVLAKYHNVGFMVVAPTSTIDMSLDSGKLIPIEARGAAEVAEIQGKRIAPAGVAAENPVFDVTPAELIDVIVTEKGVVVNPTREKMLALFEH